MRVHFVVAIPDQVGIWEDGGAMDKATDGERIHTTGLSSPWRPNTPKNPPLDILNLKNSSTYHGDGRLIILLLFQITQWYGAGKHHLGIDEPGIVVHHQGSLSALWILFSCFIFSSWYSCWLWTLNFVLQYHPLCTCNKRHRDESMDVGSRACEFCSP